MSDKEQEGKVELPKSIEDYEVLVNLKKYWINREKAQMKMDRFFEHFKGKGRVDLGGIEDIMKMEEINEKLFLPAHNAAIDQKPLPEFITGVRIFMGMRDEKTIQLIYRSEYLKKCMTTDKDRFKGIAIPVDENQYYEVSGGVLIDLPCKEAESSINRYKEIIEIKRFRIGFWQKYDEGDQDRHDTRSIFFSFQEIFGLYYKEYPEKAGQGIYDEEMTISCAARFKVSFLNAFLRRAKHVVVICAKKGQESFSIGPGDDQDGNLGHVCPPSTDCKDIEYNTV